AGVGKKNLVEMRDEREQPVGQKARERRDIHLYQVRQISVDHASQRGADRRMVAPDREYSKAAQQVEIALALAVVEILAASLAKADVIPDGLENANHLLVEATSVQVKAVGFVGF